VLVATLAAVAACGTLSVEDEKKLGAQAQREVRDHFQLFRDRVVVNYVRKLGDSLVAAAEPSPFEFRFYVVEDDQINAFAVPAGAIYVNTGTILATGDVSGLAGVMAHEIGHVTARHVAQLYNRQRNTGIGANILAIAIAILTGNPYLANAGQLATGVAATAYTSAYGREAEREADALGIETMIRAGYDPQGMVSVLEALAEEDGGGSALQFLANHPATAERIRNVQGHIAAAQPPPGLRRDDGGKLEIIQERIRLLMGTDPVDAEEGE
jgi:predicted Zn-dependent protease